MNSRVAISTLFILIAGAVIASQGSGLLRKLKVFEASCANEISEVQTLLILDRASTTGNPPCPTGTISPDAQTVIFNCRNTKRFLGSPARHLERLVLNVIHSDHQGE
jgi:hypothetical protein